MAINYWIHLQGHDQDHPTQYVLEPSWKKGKKERKVWMDSSKGSKRGWFGPNESDPNSAPSSNSTMVVLRGKSLFDLARERNMQQHIGS